ncbi:hypothetical protein SARC_15649, partial [Sphaeroforma arctica JP610]
AVLVFRVLYTARRCVLDTLLWLLCGSGVLMVVVVVVCLPDVLMVVVVAVVRVWCAHGGCCGYCVGLVCLWWLLWLFVCLVYSWWLLWLLCGSGVLMVVVVAVVWVWCAHAGCCDCCVDLVCSWWLLWLLCGSGVLMMVVVVGSLILHTLRQSGETGSLRANMSNLAILCYHYVIVYYLNLVKEDTEAVDRVLDNSLQQYPNGAFFLFYKGRRHLAHREPDQAI